MGNPVIFAGRRAKALTADGLLLKSKSKVDNDGAINYINNGHAEVNTTGWATYANTAQATPVNGTGGSPTVTLTRTTSSPLRGQASFLFTKDAANRQGQGASYDFSIDSADQAKPQQVSFDYSIASGTYADGDLTIYLYDVTNSLVIQPAGYSILNTTVNQAQKATFQTSAVSTSYRLIFHCASTSASAYTIKIDNISCGPIITSIGPAIQDTKNDLTFTPNNFGTVTAIDCRYSRNGDKMSGQLRWTCGTNTASVASVTLPLSIDSSKISSAASGKIVGFYHSLASSDTNVYTASTSGFVFYDGSDTTKLYFAKASGNTSGVLDKSTASGIAFGNTLPIDIVFYDLPISGWSSNSVVSSDTDTRVVAARASGTPASTTAGNIIILGTSDFDTHGAYSTSTGRYTMPVSGYLRISTYLNTTNGSNVITAYVNGSNTNVVVAYTDSTGRATGSNVIKVNAGDLVDLRPTGTTGTSGASTITFDRISGPSQIAASESVNARYFSSSTSISSSLATIVWTTKDFDSHNQMSSGIYTVPVSGKYQINSALGVDATFSVNNLTTLEIQKNSSVVSRNISIAAASQTRQLANVSDIISCIAGDTLRIQVSTDGTTPTITSSNFRNYISIARVGN